MLSYGFYNSKGGDRKYDAEQFGAMFNGLITDGVFAHYKDALKVTAGSGNRELVVNPGRAWFNGTWTEVDDNGHRFYLMGSAVETTYFVYLAVNKSDRKNTIAWYSSIANDDPEKGLYFYLLAQVTIPGGVTKISDSMITDTRGSDLCPYVTGIMETISFEELVKRVCGDSWQDWLGVYESGITTGVQNALAVSKRALEEVQSVKAYAVESESTSYIWAKFEAVPTGGGGFEWATESVHTELSDPPMPVCLFRDLSYADVGPGFKPSISLNTPYIVDGESTVKAIPALTQSKVWKEYPYFWEGGAAYGTDVLRYDDLQRVIVSVGGTASEKYRYRVSRLVHIPVTYEPGVYIGTVTADNATAYPKDGYKGGYYYIRFSATAEDVSFNSPYLSAKNVRDAIVEIARMGGNGSGTAMSVIEVEELPSTGVKGVFYIVKKPGDTDASEYLWLDRWEKIGSSGSGQILSVEMVDYDKHVKTIAHRGYSTEAPENTLPAYILAKQRGYNYAECDVSFTSDGVPVLLHDSTIDRTSNGSGSIYSMTYAEVSKYDFGSWKSADYAGTKIPTFEEFIKLCRNIGIHPYIELKNNGGYSQAAVNGLVDIVKSCGMVGKVTWISYRETFLGYVKNADPAARLGYLADTTTEDRATEAVAAIQSIQADGNEVFADLALVYLNSAKIRHFIDAGIPVEAYYISADPADVSAKILAADPYISGFCTDVCIAGKVLYDAYMQWSGDTTEKTLTSISATYSGGSVPVGTAVSGLSGVTVTAHYSDGSTATVTGYTLSGSIAEGENTVTVTYQGKTATFTVTGTAETGGGDTGGSDDGGGSGGDDSGSTETPGTLVHSWDFTQGLTDSVGGYTAELSGATQDSTGLHLNAASNFARLCDDLAQGDIVEVDVGALNAQDWGGKHGRLICFTDWADGYSSGAGTYGIVYRSTGEWNIYKNPWGTGGVLTDIAALANKTVRIDTGTGVAYADGVMFTDNDGWRDAPYLLLGASEKAYFNATILAVRVYRPT